MATTFDTRPHTGATGAVPAERRYHAFAAEYSDENTRDHPFPDGPLSSIRLRS